MLNIGPIYGLVKNPYFGANWLWNMDLLVYSHKNKSSNFKVLNNSNIIETELKIQ